MSCFKGDFFIVALAYQWKILQKNVEFNKQYTKNMRVLHIFI